MFQPDPNQWPMRSFPEVLAPQFRGGVAPLRHDVALSDYLQKQSDRRQALSAEHAGANVLVRLRDAAFRIGRGLFGAVLGARHGSQGQVVSGAQSGGRA